MDDRIYLVIPTSITGSINFDEIYDTSEETLRLSADGTKTIVEYNSGSRPSFYSEEYTEYTHSEIKALLFNTEWIIEDDSDCIDCL